MDKLEEDTLAFAAVLLDVILQRSGCIPFRFPCGSQGNAEFVNIRRLF